jgi:hypothetical protein
MAKIAFRPQMGCVGLGEPDRRGRIAANQLGAFFCADGSKRRGRFPFTRFADLKPGAIRRSQHEVGGMQWVRIADQDDFKISNPVAV